MYKPEGWRGACNSYMWKTIFDMRTSHILVHLQGNEDEAVNQNSKEYLPLTTLEQCKQALNSFQGAQWPNGYYV